MYTNTFTVYYTYYTGPTLMDLSITRGIASFLSQYNCGQHLVRGHGDIWTCTTPFLLQRGATFDTFYHKIRYVCKPSVKFSGMQHCCAMVYINHAISLNCVCLETPLMKYVLLYVCILHNLQLSYIEFCINVMTKTFFKVTSGIVVSHVTNDTVGNTWQAY